MRNAVSGPRLVRPAIRMGLALGGALAVASPAMAQVAVNPPATPVPPACPANPPAVAQGSGVAISGAPDCPAGTTPAATAEGSGIAIGNIRATPTRAVDGAIALGNGAAANGANGIAIGTNARSGDTGDPTRVATVAIGNNAQASAQNSVAIGDGAISNGPQGTAIGSGASATTNATAAGRSATAGNSAVAYGVNANAGLRGTALGQGAVASAVDSTAIGSFASTTVANSVALGRQSSATRGALTNYSAPAIAAPQTSVGEVAVGTAGGQRQITGVAAGSQATDAVNVGQLVFTIVRADTAASGIASALGGGATYNIGTGAFTGPAYSVQGTNYGNVGAALGALDTQVMGNTGQIQTNANAITALQGQQAVASGQIATLQGQTASNTGSIASLQRQVTTNTSNISQTQAQNVSQQTQIDSNTNAIAAISGGQAANGIGLVVQPGSGSNILVGAANDGGAVDFSGLGTGNPGDTRRLIGVAAGGVFSGSTEAVNGGQLSASQQSVASALGGGSTVNGDGTLTAPSYSVLGTTQNNVGAAIGLIDSQLTAQTGQIATLQTQSAVNTGAIATLQGQTAANTAAIGTANQNVSNLTSQINAGTIGLVQQAGASANVTVAANSSGSAVDFSGAGGTQRVLTGVADGLIAPGSVDAVNGGQLAITNAAVQDLISIVNVNGQGAFQTNGVALPSASGANSSAGGSGAVASGDSSTALGASSSASGANSVALGAGSTDGGEANVVSVGSAVATRRITNVSPGVNATDVANMGQLNSGLSQTLASANAYTDNRIAQLGFDLREVRSDMRRGIAAATAIGYAPMPSAPGRTSYALNASTFRGQQAIGGALAHRFDTGRPFAVTAGFAFAGKGNNVARVGVAGEF